MEEKKLIAGVWHHKVPCIVCKEMVWASLARKNTMCSTCTWVSRSPMDTGCGGGVRVERTGRTQS